MNRVLAGICFVAAFSGGSLFGRTPERNYKTKVIINIYTDHMLSGTTTSRAVVNDIVVCKMCVLNVAIARRLKLGFRVTDEEGNPSTGIEVLTKPEFSIPAFEANESRMIEFRVKIKSESWNNLTVWVSEEARALESIGFCIFSFNWPHDRACRTTSPGGVHCV